jgi:signal transduction histidine kinase
MGRRSWRRLVLTLFATTLFGTNVLGASDQPRVLVVHSTRQESQLTRIADRDFPTVLSNQLARSIDYYSEYLDSARIAGPQQERAFRDLLFAKYRRRRLNLVIAMQDTAWDFVRKYRSQLFPDTPVVFLSRNSNVPRPANTTGVISQINFRATLDMALLLQPEVRRVFVVTGASSRDKQYENLARLQLHTLEPRVTVTYLAGLPRAELERRVAMLPEASIVYFLLFYQDGNGENTNPLEFLTRLTALANRPAYSWVDAAMGRGIVGGRLENQSSLVQAAADMSTRILRGERADTIALSTADLTLPQVDSRQLRRWGIAESRVPSGTRVLYDEQDSGDSTWLQLAVWPVSLTVVVLAAMVVWTQRRRKTSVSPFGAIRLEDRLRDLGRQLLKAQEEERSRIALELHDDISQQAVALAIDLQRIIDGSTEQVRRIVRDAQKRVKGLLKSVHDLSHRLHPANLRLVGLVSALSQLQRDLSRPGITITVFSENVAPILPDDVALCLFRIAQEAIQNAIKYSGARNIRVQLQGETQRITLNIIDDGTGFDVESAAGKGLGLLSMHERAESVGGTLKIVSRKNAGTRVQASVPLAAPAAHVSHTIAS